MTSARGTALSKPRVVVPCMDRFWYRNTRGVQAGLEWVKAYVSGEDVTVPLCTFKGLRERGVHGVLGRTQAGTVG